MKNYTPETISLLIQRESPFNMTWEGKGEDIEEEGGGRLRKFLDTRKGGSEKIVGLGGGAPKICILQNQQEGGAPKKLNS